MPWDRLHDFNTAAAKTFFLAENMPAMAECVDMKDVIFVDHWMGWTQIFFEYGLENRAQGVRHLMEIPMYDLPFMIMQCGAAWKLEKPQLNRIYERSYY